MAYSEAQKALAREVIKRHGGEITQTALTEIRQLLDMPNLGKTTVWRWVADRANASSVPESELKPKKKTGDTKPLALPTIVDLELKAEKSLDAMFEEVTRLYLEKALTAAAGMTGQQLVTAAAIAYDKMRLARGLPTEIVSLVASLLPMMEKAGVNPIEFFNEVGNQLARQKPETWTQ